MSRSLTKTVLWRACFLLLTVSASSAAYPADLEREAFARLVSIAEIKYRGDANGDKELLAKYFAEFPPHSEPPGFFMSGTDLLITSEDSVKVFGRRSPVPILVVPSLKAILSNTNPGMSYEDALSNLANFPSGNIQELVIQTIKSTSSLGIRISAMLSLRRVSLTKATTRYLADHLRGSNSDLRLAALYALQPYALGDDLSGVQGIGFGLPAPVLAQSLRFRDNAYDVDYVLSSVRRSGFEAKAASLLLGLLAAPQFIDSDVSVTIATKLQHLHAPTKGEDAFISYSTKKILRK